MQHCLHADARLHAVSTPTTDACLQAISQTHATRKPTTPTPSLTEATSSTLYQAIAHRLPPPSRPMRASDHRPSPTTILVDARHLRRPLPTPSPTHATHAVPRRCTSPTPSLPPSLSTYSSQQSQTTHYVKRRPTRRTSPHHHLLQRRFHHPHCPPPRVRSRFLSPSTSKGAVTLPTFKPAPARVCSFAH